MPIGFFFVPLSLRENNRYTPYGNIYRLPFTNNLTFNHLINITTMANNNNENKNQLQVQIKPELADGKYSNLAMIGHGPNEFLIDNVQKYESTFGEIVPKRPNGNNGNANNN